MTEEEWARVQEALCVGNLRQTIEDILEAHSG